MTTESDQLFPCACCGYLQLSEGTHDAYEICEICFWEDDPVQFVGPEFQGGANRPSLRRAPANFLEFGACDRETTEHVRPPTGSDHRPPGWRTL